MVNDSLIAETKPLKEFLLEQIKASVPTYEKRILGWGELATGLAVVVKFQPPKSEFSLSSITSGIRDARGSLRSEHTIRSLIKSMMFYRLIVQTSYAKGATAYRINFEIPGELCA